MSRTSPPRPSARCPTSPTRYASSTSPSRCSTPPRWTPPSPRSCARPSGRTSPTTTRATTHDATLPGLDDDARSWPPSPNSGRHTPPVHTWRRCSTAPAPTSQTTQAKPLRSVPTGRRPSSAAPTNASVSNAIAATDARPLQLGDMPTAATFAGAFRLARRSAPGPDGIPASAWAASGRDGARIIQGLFAHLTSTAATPKSLHQGIMVFLPKPTGEQARDVEWQAARSAPECRPLTLRNCDAKAIASATAFRARPGLAAWADESQRGVIRGRQFIDNVTDVDSRARVLTALTSADRLDPEALAILDDTISDADRRPGPAPPGREDCEHFVCDPVLIFFDFSQAFPSAAHTNMRRGVDMTAPPAGARRYLHRLCAPSTATIRLRETTPIRLRINAGVAQGCPMSGMAFILMLDPYLKLMRRVLAPTGAVRGFAVDVAALVADPYRQLRPLASVFRAAGVAAGLRLKPRKCKIAPLRPGGCTDAHRALATPSHSASSRLVRVRDHASHHLLGHPARPRHRRLDFLGRRDAQVHHASVGDCGRRTLCVPRLPRVRHTSRTDAHVRRLGHHTAQRLAPPSPGALRTRLIHAPCNAVPQEALFHPELLGLRRVAPLDTLCKATMYRAATTTATMWRGESARLQQARARGGALIAPHTPQAAGVDLGWALRALSSISALNAFRSSAPRPKPTPLSQRAHARAHRPPILPRSGLLTPWRSVPRPCAEIELVAPSYAGPRRRMAGCSRTHARHTRATQAHRPRLPSLHRPFDCERMDHQCPVARRDEGVSLPLRRERLSHSLPPAPPALGADRGMSRARGGAVDLGAARDDVRSEGGSAHPQRRRSSSRSQRMSATAPGPITTPSPH